MCKTRQSDLEHSDEGAVQALYVNESEDLLQYEHPMWRLFKPKH